MAIKPCHLLLSTSLLVAGTGLGAAQTTQTVEITTADPAYQFNAGFNYTVLDLTITHAAEFSFDVTQLIRLDTDEPLTLNVLGYLFRAGTALPVDPSSQLDHQDAATLVASLSDGAPNAEGPVTAMAGAAGPLTEGQYQLILAPFDLFGFQGDHRLTFTITGGVLILLPTVVQEAAQLSYSSAIGSRAAVSGAAGTAGRQGQVSLSSRGALPQVRRDAGTGAVAVAASSRGITGGQGAPGLVGNTYTWLDLSGFQLDVDAIGLEATGRGLQVGADWGLGTDWVAGLSFRIDDITSSSPGFEQDRVLRVIQPYVAYDRGYFHAGASVMFGWGEVSQTSIGGTGQGDTTLRAASLEMGYDFAAWGGAVLTPTLSVLHGVEEIRGTGGTLAGAGRSSVAFTEVSLGTTAARGFGNGLTGSVGLFADWVDLEGARALVDDRFGDQGWRGRLALGVSGEMANGLGVQTSLEFGGIGSDTRELRGGVRVAFTF